MTATATAVYLDWHAWDANGGVLLSDETTKKLRAFDSWDDCITWLYLSGHKEAARAFHKATKRAAT